MQVRFTEDIVPVTDFRNNAAEVLSTLAANGRPIVLTQRGRAAAVLLDVKTFQRIYDRVRALEARLGQQDVAPDAPPVAPETDAFVKELERWISPDPSVS